MATMRAKVVVTRVERIQGAENLTMNPVCKSSSYGTDGLDEDNTFAKFSPSGEFKLMVTNPALHGQFNPGDKFYVDFTPAQ